MENMTPPLVSVIIPSYNHIRYVEKSVMSVINQQYAPIELIVVDDGSKDDSPQLLKQLQHQHGFTLVCRENKGLSATLNEAINQYAHGKYIRILASDDYWPENSVKDLVSYMENNPKKAFACGWGYSIDDEGRKLQDIAWGKPSEDVTFEMLLDDDSFILAPTTIFKRDILVETGGFDENLVLEDWDFWLKIAFNHPGGYLSQSCLAFYRIHENSTCSKVKIMIKNRKQILEKWKKKIPDSSYHRIWSRHIFRHFRLLSGKEKTAALNLLFRYRFRYLDYTMLKDFIKGNLNLIFNWK